MDRDSLHHHQWTETASIITCGQRPHIRPPPLSPVDRDISRHHLLYVRSSLSVRPPSSRDHPPSSPVERKKHHLGHPPSSLVESGTCVNSCMDKLSSITQQRKIKTFHVRTQHFSCSNKMKPCVKTYQKLVWFSRSDFGLKPRR